MCTTIKIDRIPKELKVVRGYKKVLMTPKGDLLSWVKEAPVLPLVTAKGPLRPSQVEWRLGYGQTHFSIGSQGIHFLPQATER